MTPEERAARERKQKIFVGVGGVFMVLLLVFFTLPKVLSASSSPETAPTETTSTTPGQVSSAPEGTAPSSATGTGTATPVAQSTVLATTKLSSFSVFDAKDPFVQQVVTENGVEASAAAATAAADETTKGTKEAPGSTEKFTTGAKGAAAATIVTVNGARQVVEPGTRFPTGDPLFVLVAEKPGAKSVVIGIVGGAYSGGDRTTTLRLGKPLTLVNTTTGAKYKISLVSVGSGESSSEQPPAEQ